MESGPVAATNSVYIASGGGQQPNQRPGMGRSRIAQVVSRQFAGARPDKIHARHTQAHKTRRENPVPKPLSLPIMALGITGIAAKAAARAAGLQLT
jgi:hypothetical protein